MTESTQPADESKSAPAVDTSERASFHARVMALRAADEVRTKLAGPPLGFYLLGWADNRDAAAEIASEADALIAEHETRERFMLAATRDAQEFAAHYGDVMTQRGQEIERLKAKADALAEAAQGLQVALIECMTEGVEPRSCHAALAAYAKAAGESA